MLIEKAGWLNTDDAVSEKTPHKRLDRGVAGFAGTEVG
jgi:hypothetical protein